MKFFDKLSILLFVSSMGLSVVYGGTDVSAYYKVDEYKEKYKDRFIDVSESTLAVSPKGMLLNKLEVRSVIGKVVKEEKQRQEEENKRKLEEEKRKQEEEKRRQEEEKRNRDVNTRNDNWGGAVLNKSIGTITGPSGKETYYNLPMQGVISIMRGIGNTDEYWVRSDGVKMLGKYVMVAADLGIRPRGSLVETSLGMGIVCDTGSFTQNNRYQLDIAVDW